MEVNVGHVMARVRDVGKMYLGLEHSTTMRKGGHVLKSLTSLIQGAISEDNIVAAHNDAI